MRRKMRTLVLVGFFAGLTLVGRELSSAEKTARIDAERGKEYKLTKVHGPWMILAATFREPPPEARIKGMTPNEAADELVYELRSKGIPAYKLLQNEVVDTVQTVDRTGKVRTRQLKAQQDCISVLAGNYPDTDPETSEDGNRAQKTLTFVKNYHPTYLKNEEKRSGFLHKLRNGGMYRATPGRPKPLSGAFLTVNPLLSPEEAPQKKSNPLLQKLNSGSEYSLLENDGKYTLVVASFQGKSAIQIPNSREQDTEKNFKVTSSLDDAAYTAWELAKSLRQHEKKFDAYVWHDKYSSIVTVGSFSSPNDSRLAELKKLFGAKHKPNPQTGQDMLLAEMLTIPYKVPPGKMPEKRWMFDPVPRVIEVPKL